ncbi:MAG TPA: hypothetical protein VH436_09010 [Vicinamibacterales bacterium]|jgi:hypothetical protein
MDVPKAERATLPRDVSEFLVEFSIALHRHTMYPSGHPSLEPAVGGVVRSAERALQKRASLAIGVSRRQLLVDEVSTDPNQPVLRRLADALHRHQIGAVSVTRGASAHEMGEALRCLARDPEREGALGLAPDGVTRWPHLKLHPLTFDSLALGAEGAAAEPGGRAVSRAVDVWADLARAALAIDTVGESGEPIAPAVIARAINGHAEGDAYDEAIVRYLVEIAHELTGASDDNAPELHKRTMELIGALDSGTLRRLVRMGGDAEQRHQFVRDATHGMATDAVLEIVKAAVTDQQTISHGLLRMLAKLAGHAQRGTELARPRADREFRQQVGRLLDNWTLADPNPHAYNRVLEGLASATGQSPPPTHQRAEPPSSLRVVLMSLESNTYSPHAERAVDEMVKSGRLNDLFELLAAPPPHAAPTADKMLAKLTSPEAVTALLAQDRVDLSGLDALLPRLSLESFGPLLDAMGSSPSRQVRRRLLDWLAQAPVDLGSLVIARLNDERWYVQRNMLVLLQRSGRIPPGFSPGPWTHHKDPRVRTEAIRLQLAMSSEKLDGVRAALDDEDPRVVRLGLAAIPSDCPGDVIDRVIDWAIDTKATEDLRQFAATTLGRFRDESALNALLHLADGGRTWFGRPRLPAKTPVLIAVLRALTDTWRDHALAARVRAVAARSSDPDIRQAAT